MATVINFTSLVQDVSNYLERGGSLLTDQTVFNQIPRLINAAERNIMQYLKLQGELETLANPINGLPIGNSVIAKPDRWRITRSINYGAGPTFNNRTPLFPRGYEYCRSYWPDSTQTSPPQFYADYGLTHWLVVPTPDKNYPAEFNCYMQPVPLDGANQSNFFTTYTGNLLLYETLVQAEPFLKDDARMQVWASERDRQIGTLQAQELQKIMDQGSTRTLP
jgi:hypothetical protein